MTCNNRAGLVVYVLAHGRPQYTVQAVRSVMEQEVAEGFRLIVSDNTMDDSVCHALEAAGLAAGAEGRSTKLEYMRREREDVAEHVVGVFNEALSAGARYLVMFHNDDIMLPGMLETELAMIKKGHYGACGCDAWLIDDKGRQKTYTIQGYHVKPGPNVEAHSALEVFRACSAWYPTPPLGIWPSYMYDLQLMGDVPVMDKGKYSDEIWIAHIAEKTGAVISIGQPLMLYRRYNKQDSYTPSVRSRYLWNQEYAKVAKDVKDWRGIRKGRVYEMLKYTTQMRHHKPSERQLRVFRRSMLLRDRLAGVVVAVGDCLVPPFARAYRDIMPGDLRKVLWNMRHPFRARKMRRDNG